MCFLPAKQAIEKMLKALVVRKTKSFPPRIHDLIKLSSIAKLDLDIDQKDFLAQLNYFYLETRYPIEISDVSKRVSKDTATTFYSKTRKTLKWLKSKVL